MTCVRDLASYIDVYQSDYATITTDTNTDGAVFDMKDHEMGVCFVLSAPAWTDGTYTLSILECDTSGGTYTAVAAASLIGDTASVGAQTADGGLLDKQGCFSTKRYLKARIVSTSTSSGATINVTIIKAGEYLPL